MTPVFFWFPVTRTECKRVKILRDGSGPGESGYSSKPAPFGPGMEYTYWTVDIYEDTRINPRGDGGGDGLRPSPAVIQILQHPKPKFGSQKLLFKIWLNFWLSNSSSEHLKFHLS